MSCIVSCWIPLVRKDPDVQVHTSGRDDASNLRIPSWGAARGLLRGPVLISIRRIRAIGNVYVLVYRWSPPDALHEMSMRVANGFDALSFLC